MELPVYAKCSKCGLKLAKGHGLLGFDQRVARPVTANRQVQSQVIRLNIPYRVAADAAQTGWPAVSWQVHGVARSHRHAPLTGQNHVGSIDSRYVWGCRVPWPDAQQAGAWADGRQPVLRLDHAAVKPHRTSARGNTLRQFTTI